MNEFQRMQYLDALGVDTFVPRLLLPNAKASVQCVSIALDEGSNDAAIDTPLSATERPSSDATALSSAALKSLNEGLSGVLSALDLDEAKPAKSANKAAESQPNVAEVVTSVLENTAVERVADLAEKAEFNLALWFTDRHLQIIDSRGKDDALPTDALLANVLIASGLLNTHLPTAEVQRWPIPGTNLADQSWAAASSMLFDFLSYRLESQPAKAFVLFGEAAAKSVMGSQFDFQAKVFCAEPSAAYGVMAIVLPSLRDLLYSPALKRKLWPALALLKSVS